MANEPETMKDRVGTNLRRLRGQMTLAELSARLTAAGQPIGISTLSKIELGQRRISVDDLVALAAAVGVDPGRLLGSAASQSVDRVRMTFADLDIADEAWSEARHQYDLAMADLATAREVVKRADERRMRLATRLAEELDSEAYSQLTQAEKLRVLHTTNRVGLDGSLS